MRELVPGGRSKHPTHTPLMERVLGSQWVTSRGICGFASLTLVPPSVAQSQSPGAPMRTIVLAAECAPLRIWPSMFCAIHEVASTGPMQIRAGFVRSRGGSNFHRLDRAADPHAIAPSPPGHLCFLRSARCKGTRLPAPKIRERSYTWPGSTSPRTRQPNC